MRLGPGFLLRLGLCLGLHLCLCNSLRLSLRLGYGLRLGDLLRLDLGRRLPAEPAPVALATTVAPDGEERAVLPIAIPLNDRGLAQLGENSHTLVAELLSHSRLHHPGCATGQAAIHLIGTLINTSRGSGLVVAMALALGNADAVLLGLGAVPGAAVQARADPVSVTGEAEAPGIVALALDG